MESNNYYHMASVYFNDDRKHMHPKLSGHPECDKWLEIIEDDMASIYDVPDEIFCNPKFLSKLDSFNFTEISSDLLTEQLYLKMIDESNSIRCEFLSFPINDAVTDRVIEETLKKFPSKLVELGEDEMKKNGKKWYDLAVYSHKQNKIPKMIRWKAIPDTIFYFF